MTGTGVDQYAVARLIGGRYDGGERSTELAIEHTSRRLHRFPRREASLQVRPQRKANERSMRQRLAAMSGDITDDDRQLAILERKHVIEIPSRSGTVRRSISRGGRYRTEPGGRNRKQRSLEQAHVLEQLCALALQSPGSQRDEARAYRECKRQCKEDAYEYPYRRRHHSDDPGDRRHKR